MQPNRHRNAAADVTGWLLGSIIVVLAVLDLLIWATLWNVPNPGSKWLTPQATVRDAPQAAVSFAPGGAVEPALLTGAPKAALPRSRAQ